MQSAEQQQELSNQLFVENDKIPKVNQPTFFGYTRRDFHGHYPKYSAVHYQLADDPKIVVCLDVICSSKGTQEEDLIYIL
jgi:NADH:ubiquinone oxidoreductase subunit E